MSESIKDQQDKILNNARLFIAIRKDKEPNEKQKKIIKYLERGADINAFDANDNCNTPLHLAVIKAETETVSFLLQHGANASLKNNDGQTAADIAQQYSKEIYDLLNQNSVNISTNNKDINNDEVKTKTVCKQVQGKDDLTTAHCHYQKRKGTSGLSGHLYETKLLTLILLRAELNNELEEFYLGTNIEGLGAFDDIVFQYKRKGQPSKTIFLQAKHKDDPINNKIKVDDMFKKGGDFCFQKYFDSYLEINEKFESKINDVLFKGTTLRDCEFIIYTSATENFAEKTSLKNCHEACFIETSKNGQIFQLRYDDGDLKKMLQSVVETRAASLAKTLSKFIFKEKWDSIMADDMIKIYHVFVAHNVLSQDSESKCWKFRESFLDTNDELLIIMKRIFIAELNIKKRSPLNETDPENEIRSLSFQLPSNFGNVTFNLKEKKRQKQLDILCTKLCQLFGTAYEQDLKRVIEVNERSCNEGNILQKKDLEPHLIGGLVGNLLIIDDETKMLKFNLNQEILTGDSLELLKMLQNKEKNLEKYRFEFTIPRFPKLSLINEKIDVIIITDFLAKLIFFTNQAKEDQIESILRNEIQEICNSQKQTLGIKCEAILLKMHDRVLKWWKQPKSATYFNQSTQCFQETMQNILSNTLLTTFDFVYTKSMETLKASFNPTAVNALNLHFFIQGNVRICVLQSNEVLFTCIKLKQYFKENVSITYIFFELSADVTDYDLVTIQEELKKIALHVLVLVYRSSNTLALDQKLKAVSDAFQGKIIIVTNEVKEIKETLAENVIENHDDKIRFLDCSTKTQKNIVDQGKLIFQGITISFNPVILEKLKPHIIRHIMNRETIMLGEALAINSEKVPYYLNRSICRCIILGMRNPDFAELYFINDWPWPRPTTLQEHQDIVIMSDNEKIFDESCRKYRYRNVHWFSREVNGSGNIWLKSRGGIKTLHKYVDNETRSDHILRPETIKDVKDKYVVVSAEPGMGKSTLLMHLAFRTKIKFPTMWISIINLVEHVHIFSKWQAENTTISLKEVILFLYGAVNIKVQTEKSGKTKYTRAVSENIRNRISINSLNKVYLDGESDSNDLFDMGVHYFNYCYNNDQLALLFDGFDEICPEYTNEVIKMLIVLKSYKHAHLWVTTRPYENILNQLENALGTFSFILQPLDIPEQQHLLRQIWCTPLNLNRKNFFNAWSYIHTFHAALTSSIGVDDDGLSFTSIPLHLNMIADLFQDSLQVILLNKLVGDGTAIKLTKSHTKILNDLSNICTLYEIFVNTKFFKIRFGNLKHSMKSKDMHFYSHIWNMDKYIQKEHEAFLNIHKKFGAYLLLNIHNIPDLFSKEVIDEINVFIRSVKSGEEKTGIVECSTITKEPKFVHLTYAEYFAIEFICDKLKDGSCMFSTLKCLIDYICCFQMAGMRRFFTSKLSKFPQLLDFITENSDHCSTVLEILLSQISLQTTALHVLVEGNYNATAKFLLKCTRTAINKNNIDDFITLLTKFKTIGCVMCFILTSNQVNLLNCIFDIIKHVDGYKIQKLFYCEINHLALAISKIRNLDMKTVPVLLNEISCYKNFMVDLFTVELKFDPTTASKALSKKFLIKSISHHLKELSAEQLTKIFTVKNCNGLLPAHYAAEIFNYDYFETMLNLLGRDKFRSICLTEDNRGDTPIMYFQRKQFTTKHLRNIIEIVYEGQDIDDVTVFILKKKKNNMDNFLKFSEPT
ncbi:unnamed protein product [Chrysodeixis includens]|uniref:NACHT domain-containing protein n=1 Tax=Chrysodeixis includens TaxID=689277 RepID=A0A9N8KY83_CHRIL|nr:unnamed protein product [Chrysodeixis includens]